MSYGNVLKRPAVPEENGIFMEFFEEQDAVLRQSQSHARPRMKRSPCEVKSRDSSVKPRGKYKRQPLGVLRFRAKWQRSQPRWLCEGATAELTRSDRHSTAESNASKRNEMKLCCGCGSFYKWKESGFEDWECRYKKKSFSFSEGTEKVFLRINC